MLSPYYAKNKTIVEDFNQIPIQITYQFQDKKVFTKELFPVGSTFPATKSITFAQLDGPVSLLVHYHDKYKLLEGLPNQIAQYEILQSVCNQQTPTAKFSLVLRVTNNHNNIPLLDKAEVIQEYTEQLNGKLKDMTRTEALKFKLSSYALAPKDKKTLLELENQMTSNDEKILEIKRMSSELEAAAYEMRRILEANQNIEQGQRSTIEKFVAETIEWIYDDGKGPVSAVDYQSRLEYL